MKSSEKKINCTHFDGNVFVEKREDGGGGGTVVVFTLRMENRMNKTLACNLIFSYVRR